MNGLWSALLNVRTPTIDARTQAGGQPLTVILNVDGSDILALQADANTTLGAIWPHVVAAASADYLDGPEYVDIRIVRE